MKFKKKARAVISPEYIMDGRMIMMPKIDKSVKCGICGMTLVLVNAETLMIRTHVSLLGKDEEGKPLLTLKCGKCKTYNAVNLNSDNQIDDDGKCLLTV